jgi:hypothetical protein
MQVSLDQAVEIYARASRAWFGVAAQKRIEERANELSQKEDYEGARIWQRVNKAIQKLESDDQRSMKQ